MTQHSKVIILNGPPSSGKDTFCHHARTLYPQLTHQEFKAPLREIVRSLYQATLAGMADMEKFKEVADERLDGRTYREAMIHTSEVVVKPNFGQDYLGKLAAKNLQPGVNIFSDGGFGPEVDALAEVVGYGNITIVRLHRDGCDFSKDSRRYLNMPGVNTIDAPNNGTLADLFLQVQALFQDGELDNGRGGDE